MQNWFASNFQQRQAYLIEEIISCLMVFQQYKSQLPSLNLNIVDALDLGQNIRGVGFKKANKSQLLKSLIFNIRQIGKNIDACWHFTRMCSYFYRFYQRRLIKGDCQQDGVFAKPLALPVVVSGGEIGSGLIGILAGTVLYFIEQMHYYNKLLICGLFLKWHINNIIRGMQHEGESKPNYNLPEELTDLLAVFLEGPTPEIELQMTQFPLEQYFKILNDRDQAKEIRLACCSALKGVIAKRQRCQNIYQQILAQVEALYLSCEQDISGSLQIVLERMFQMYLDDHKKLITFEKVIQNLTACPDIKASFINQKILRITVLLVRAMASSTLNNQICIGALICYLKHIYYDKNKITDTSNPSGRGLQLLVQAMNNEPRPELQSFLNVQIEVVKLIREIIERVEQDETQEPQILPALYIRNSSEIQRLFTGIICVSLNGRLYCRNETVNELKAQLLELYSQNYMYHLQKPFLMAAISTITGTNVLELQDYSMQIVASLLLLVERSTSFSEYAEVFFNVTQILVIKLFQVVSAKQAERQALTHDPEHFAEIADDFCKTQESDTIKARAGSLIYNLCLCIDGNLTFVTNFALISLLDLQRKALAALMPNYPAKVEAIRTETAMKTLLQLWPFGGEEITQTSILILCSISDLLAKRNEFNSAIQRHLQVMHSMFGLRQQTISFFPVIILCRYLQLFSFFSSPNCLEPFVPLYSLNEAIAQTMLKGLETIIQYHDKKDDNMRTYVAIISTKVLLLSEKLTPLLQTTIISRPELLLCVKERLLEKLVIWLLGYLNDGNVFASNKIANLLCKVLAKYPEYLIQGEQQLYYFQLQALAQYLFPLYRHLLISQHQEAEQCVIDVAVSHCEVLKTNMNQNTAQQFLRLGIIVAQRNKGVLNKCLQLFSRLLSILHGKVILQKGQFQKIQSIRLIIASQLLQKAKLWLQSVQQRTQNLWQLAYLFQLILATYEISQERPNQQLLDFSFLFKLVQTAKSSVLTTKVLLLGFLIMHIYPNNLTEGWLLRNSLPEYMPPWQKDHLCIYILRSINRFNSIQIRAKLIIYTLALILPNEKLKKYLEKYEESLHVLGEDEAQIFANQTAKEVSHPLSCWPIDCFEQFRKMINAESQWQELRRILGKQGQNRVRQALAMKKVGSRIRHIVKVKPIDFKR